MEIGVRAQKKNTGSSFQKTRCFERGERESNPRVTDLQSVALATWLPPQKLIQGNWAEFAGPVASEFYTESIGRRSMPLEAISGENLV